jgi:polysaccharide export outer membrane protein
MLAPRVLAVSGRVKAMLAATAMTLVTLVGSGCVGPGTVQPVGDALGPQGFHAPDRRSEAFATTEQLIASQPPEEIGVYRIGPGDRITIDVYGHRDLSGPQVVGPDGRITVNVAGPVKVSGLSSEQAAERITSELSGYYRDAVATVRIDEYVSNEVLVLGRVAQPGPVIFRKTPTLLDALARAGALPSAGAGATKVALTRCAVFRGRDQVFWVDLSKLLSGRSTAYNITLERDDVVYIPDADDQLVYVLGQVHKPGAIYLTPDMSFMDALAQAGGPTNDGNWDEIALIRPQDGVGTEIALAEVFQGDDRKNVTLRQGDIIYVPMTGMAQVGYVLQQLSPATNYIGIATAAIVK